jgi:hypothetical protein
VSHPLRGAEVFEFPYCPDSLAQVIDSQGGMSIKIGESLRFCPIIMNATEIVVGLNVVQVSVRSNERIVLEGLRLASPQFRLRHYTRPLIVCQTITGLSSNGEPLLGKAKAISIEQLCRTDGNRYFDFVRNVRTLRVV